MSAALILLVLSALIGFGLGTWFRWPAIAASSVAIAVLSSAILQIQGFGTLPGIAIVVACLTVSQMAYLGAASLRQDLLFQQQAHKATTCDSRLMPLRPCPCLRDEYRFSRFMLPCALWARFMSPKRFC